MASMESCGHTSVASLATGRSAFFGNKFPVPVPNRRQAVHFRQRCNTRAILEKAREVISPSNGASASAKPSTDPSAVQADVLQNLGKQSSPECCACHKSDEFHRWFCRRPLCGLSMLALRMLLLLHRICCWSSIKQDPQRPGRLICLPRSGCKCAGAFDRRLQSHTRLLEVLHQ